MTIKGQIDIEDGYVIPRIDTWEPNMRRVPEKKKDGVVKEMSIIQENFPNIPHQFRR